MWILELSNQLQVYFANVDARTILQYNKGNE